MKFEAKVLQLSEMIFNYAFKDDFSWEILSLFLRALITIATFKNATDLEFEALYLLSLI